MYMNWKRGRTLLTPITKRYSEEEWNKNELREKSMIFSDFSSYDNGTGRKRICTLDTNHPDYELNAKLIELTPDLLENSIELYNLTKKLVEFIDYNKFPTLRDEWNKVMSKHENIIKSIPEPQKKMTEVEFKEKWKLYPLTNIY